MENQPEVLVTINDLKNKITFEVQNVANSCECHDNKQRRRVRKAVDDIFSNLSFENLPVACKDVRSSEGQNLRVVVVHKLFQEMGLCNRCATLRLLERTSGLKIFSNKRN